MWDKLHVVPGGKIIFSKLVGRAAPYTGTVRAVVQELRDGYARVTMDDRKAVRNHLDCVHAVAQLNLAELTGNIALAYSMPSDARFIVAGMSIDYIKKARGMLTGICESPTVTTSEKKEYEILVSLRDPNDVEVSRVTLRTLVGPRLR